MLHRLVVAALLTAGLVAQQPTRRTSDPFAAIREELRAARSELATLRDLDLPERSRSSGSFGVDFTTHYLFRGIPQEDRGVIAQPWFEWNLRLADERCPVGPVDFTLGTWNSLHDGPTGGAGSIWYENDVYGGFGANVLDRLRANLRYTSYHSPNAGFPTVQEVSGSLTFTDGWLLSGGLQPTVALAFETRGQADGGDERGSVWELGLEPTQTLGHLGRLECLASLPVKVGLGMHGYYESPTGGSAATFGYASIGLTMALTLPVGDGWPSPWRLEVSLAGVTLGDTNRERNGGERNELVGTIGISSSF